MSPIFHLTEFNFLVLLFLSNYLTIFCIVLYLHKYRAHGSVIPGVLLGNFCAFWLWLTTGIHAFVWATIHQNHHKYSDTEKDIHSLYRYGFLKILFAGVFIYFKEEEKILATSQDYSGYSFMERNIYFVYRKIGLLLFFVVASVLFGISYAAILLLVHIFLNLYLFAGVFNAFAHKIGYRNFHNEKQYPDGKLVTSTSTNLFPVGIFLFGEELHNNHHYQPHIANNRVKWFEFDLGYLIFTMLEKMNFLTIRKEDTAPAGVRRVKDMLE